MRGHEPLKTWFQLGIEIWVFNQIKIFLWQITLLNELFYLNDNYILVVQFTLNMEFSQSLQG